jgi:protein-S-isoprenylcysteine O-methyltransferase Ste14
MNIRLVLSRSLVVGAIAFACLGATRWHTHSPVSLALESTSVGFLLAGAIGRIWCSVHIAGRKNALVVAQGPYSVCRNPLYFFSMFAFMGAGLAFEPFTVFAIFAAVFFATHWPTILGEERYLRSVFGADHDAYCARVPRFSQALAVRGAADADGRHACVHEVAARVGADPACVRRRAGRGARARGGRAAVLLSRAVAATSRGRQRVLPRHSKPAWTPASP